MFTNGEYEITKVCAVYKDGTVNFIKQLYEYFYLLKNGIKKMQKNISSELLASLATTLIAEDTNDKHSLSQN